MAEEKLSEEGLEVSQEYDVEENGQVVGEEKKESFLKKLGGGIKSTAKKLGKGIKAEFDKVHEWNEERKAIKSSTETFEFIGDGTKIQMFRNIDEHCVYFRIGDKNANRLRSNTLLKNKGDNSIIQILEVDRKHRYEQEVNVGKEDGKSILKKILCYKATYKNYEKQKVAVTKVFNQHQNVVVERGATLNGDVVQNNYINELNQIEDAIKSYKPNMFNKRKKEEALQLFGTFRNCVINQQKNDSVFDKFIKVLGSILPAAATIATTIIAAL